jgi:hypothetical protein
MSKKKRTVRNSLGLALAWPGSSQFLGVKTWLEFGFGLALAQAIAYTQKHCCNRKVKTLNCVTKL